MSRLILKDFGRHDRRSEKGLSQNLSLLILLAAGFIILVTALAGFALGQVRAKIKADVGEALQIVLQSAHESLNLWVESNKFQLARLADDPRIVFLSQRQLGVPRRKDALIQGDALRELRNFFNPRQDQFGQAGFSIISPDFINIAAMRDDNLGAKSVIANQALDLLNHAFRGHTVMVPPVWSNIPLKSTSAGRLQNTPTMFFAAPVKTFRDEVIAVLTQRVDPSIDFSRIIQLGKMGQSGETFAFDRYGKLLSDSRFEDDLRRAGLIGEDQKSILSVSLRDPGGDLTGGFSPAVPRYQQPLTLMAEQATTGKGGLNVQGYRDYRGVPVYGAWLWDAKLQIGLSAKIDETEALSAYYTTRTAILTVLGITVILALGSLVFAVVIEERAGRALQKSHDELEFRVEERTAELQENQARLEQAEERSRMLLESATEGIFGVAADGPVNFINPAGLTMLGFEADELIGQKIHPLIHHTRADGNPYPIEECPMHHSLTRGVIGSRDDEVLWRKDGTSFPVEYNSVPILKNESIAGTVVVFRDISERREADQALRESRATARGLLDATKESLLLLDQDGIIIAVNQTAAHRFRQTPGDLVGTSLFDRLPQQLRESRKAHFINVLETGNPVDFEDVRDEMVFHNFYYPVQDKTGEIMGVAIFAQEITERRRMEEDLKLKMEELEQFSKLAIGRELKMIQLKQEINELRVRLGHEAKYEIVE
jgi:PAS domain S-box-containing protein